MDMMGDIINRAGDEYEFVFVSGPYGSGAGRRWIQDPPGGKGQPTTDPAWDVESTNLLDSVVTEQGPFFAIMGYSQGTAAALSYLSHVDTGMLTVAITFCSYVPTTHEGIENRIRAAAPYKIPMFIYIGSLILSSTIARATCTAAFSQTLRDRQIRTAATSPPNRANQLST